MLVFSKRKYIQVLIAEGSKELVDVSVKLGFLNALDGKSKDYLESKGWNLLDSFYVEKETQI